MEITKTFYAADRAAWRAWLAAHHGAAREIWLVFYKKGSGKASVSYDAAVEEALCFGWIDGIMKRVDDERYAQRFTPRRPGSTLSDLNRRRVQQLIAAGKMTSAGLAKLAAAKKAPRAAARDAAGGGKVAITADFRKALATDEKAQENFLAFAAGYQRTYVRWIQSAKRVETRARRIKEAVRLIKKGTKALMK